MAESITITDNRTGSSVEIPISDGGVAADDFRKLLPGTWVYDPAFMTTLDGYTALPPGTYRPTRSTGTHRSVTVAPGPSARHARRTRPQRRRVVTPLPDVGGAAQ